MEEREEYKMKKEYYLSEFYRHNDIEELVFPEEVEKAGEAIVEELKKRDLTYEGAYESLQWAYNKLKYESNFIRIQ